MQLEIGTQLGHYKITGLLGKGGMGEVYRAHDPRLNRDVAIKVSPQRFSERFDREARAIAALNHPNICQIYDVGPNYLVMELVEGEAPKGPMDLDDALPIAHQIAEALREAHSKKITHRDLKPANIKVTPEGRVKVLDFGLAKVGQALPPDTLGEDSPTLTMGMTQAGTILGTAAYMSPEQARGKPVDERADIWAFGVVFYEILTGQRLFKGEDLADTLATVVKVHPSLDAAPVRVRRLLDACLQKDPAKRLQSIGDMRLLIEAPRVEAVAVAPPPKRSMLWPVVAGVALLGAAALAFVHFGETPPEQPVLRLTLTSKIKGKGKGGVGFLNLSSDGRRVLIAGRVVRDLDSSEPTLIESATGNPRTPFWSPDGRFYAFFADGKLKSVSAAGGPVKELCDGTGLGAGGAWGKDGTIVFASETGRMRRVSASGGPCAAVMKDDPLRRVRFPEFMPDGTHYLYFGEIPGDLPSRGTYLASLDEPNTVPLSGKKILDDYSSVIYTPPAHSGEPSHLLFLRGSRIMAQPFDEASYSIMGDPFPVADGASFSNSAPQMLAGAGGGNLVYQTGNDRLRQLMWVDRTGKNLGTVGPVGDSRAVTLSRNGAMATTRTVDLGMHLFDLNRNSEVRFSTDANPGAAVWSPDGSFLLFFSTIGGVRGIYRKAANGSGKEELVFAAPANARAPGDLSGAGVFFFTEVDPKTNADIWYLPKLGDPAAKPLQFLATPAMESQPQLSPDDHWLAYVSDESGRTEVYIRQFPSGEGFARISLNGGIEPRWKKDGSELYFRSNMRQLTAVSIRPDGKGGISAGAPKELFEIQTTNTVPQGNSWLYAPHPDGQRFLVLMEPEAEEPQIQVITNWLKAAKGAKE